MPQNRLRSLRAERQVTLEQLSQAIGVSVSTLHALENEERRDMLLATALRLAHFYGLRVEDIWQTLYRQICKENGSSASSGPGGRC